MKHCSKKSLFLVFPLFMTLITNPIGAQEPASIDDAATFQANVTIELSTLPKPQDMPPTPAVAVFAPLHARFIQNHADVVRAMPGAEAKTSPIIAELMEFQKRFPQDAALAAMDLAFHEVLINQDAFKAIAWLDGAPFAASYSVPVTVLKAKIKIYIWSRSQGEGGEKDSHLSGAATLLDPLFKNGKLGLAALLMLAKVYYRLGDWQNAKIVLETVAKSHDDFEAWLGLSLCEAHLNNKQALREALNQAKRRATTADQKDRTARLARFAGVS